MSKRVLAILTPKELSMLSQAAGAKWSAEEHYKKAADVLDKVFDQVEENHGLNHDFAYSVHPETGKVTFKHDEDEIVDVALRLQRLHIDILPLFMLPLTALFVRQENAPKVATP